MFLIFGCKDTLFFRDVQEKSLLDAIFLVEGVECRGTECQFRERSWGELQFRV